MVASEVAIAEWTSTVSGTPAADKMSVRKGVKNHTAPDTEEPSKESGTGAEANERRDEFYRHR